MVAQGSTSLHSTEGTQVPKNICNEQITAMTSLYISDSMAPEKRECTTENTEPIVEEQLETKSSSRSAHEERVTDEKEEQPDLIANDSSAHEKQLADENETLLLPSNSIHSVGTRKEDTTVHDDGPQILIKSVENKKWLKTIQLCEDHPQHVSKIQEIDDAAHPKDEADRWGTLPLHLATVLHAPVQVIQALVDAHPDGTKICDDRQMLPLHIAFRFGAHPDIAAVLVDVYPGALTTKDSKGHTPRDILRAYRRKYQRDKEKGALSSEIIDVNRYNLIKIYLQARKSKKDKGIQKDRRNKTQINKRNARQVDTYNDRPRNRMSFETNSPFSCGPGMYSESDSSNNDSDSDSDSCNSDDDTCGSASVIQDENESIFARIFCSL